ncbi:MAG TPA: hypothetical protein VMF61_16410 [Candidatus Acidoferrales bacterium]|nr:hypothetical protein [Candidatus Acidoferrales bacterium]
MREGERHPVRLDEADRRRQGSSRVPVLLSILIVAVVVAAIAALNAHGIER